MNALNMRLGYELEGGFSYQDVIHNRDFKAELKDTLKDLKFNIGGDGSVMCHKGIDAEIKSRVYDLNNAEDLKIIIEDFKKIMPFIEGINDTCGLHFHISFKDLEKYYLLCSYKFASEFVNAYKEKFKTIEEQNRLNNHFCMGYIDKTDFKKVVKRQLEDTGKNGFRYRAVNYNSYNLYKTIEFRIFRSVDNEKKFQEYLKFVFKFVTDYIKENDFLKKSEVLASRKSYKTPIEKINKVISAEEIEQYNNHGGFY
jgi:hypothetical protein